MAPDDDSFGTLRKDAAAIFRAGLSAVQAETAVKEACRLSGNRLDVQAHSFDLALFEHIYVIGAGKASADMAAGLESVLGHRITEGAVTVKYGHIRELGRVRLTEAGHPLPDENGVKGATRIMGIAEKAGESDLVICLLSGGGSALLPLPAEPLSLSDKQQTVQALLDCGARINEINAIRKHLSAIKGGRLSGKAAPAVIITLIVSDVVGDPPDVIASGPTVGDTSTFSQCLEVIASYGIRERLPKKVVDFLERGASGRIPETPKAEDPVFGKVHNYIIADGRTALFRAREAASALGYNTLLLSSTIEGDTREAARFHTALAKEIRRSGNPVEAPACLLSGGETTMVVAGPGKGGRNQEFALVSAFEISGEEETVVLSGGTDGTDGPTDAAGAVVDGSTMESARLAGLAPRDYLDSNDSYNFFKQTGDLLITGPTGTNVMDLRVILVGKPET
jgi:hydroxypyruvate reductase